MAVSTNKTTHRTTELSDCTDQDLCKEMLYRVIDGQASSREEEIFGRKIENCMSCFKQYQYEKSMKDVIVSKIDKKSVPSSLAEDIIFKVKKLA
ncbi:hypothetical protein AB9P05_12210 [Roseivirga sp. BDSF3-8]|uniref:hypothetical protein n=1 Tax=Roseivirga sp. BDSF3-8 TaxID=3241598 RepID=UPI003531B1EE